MSDFKFSENYCSFRINTSAFEFAARPENSDQAEQQSALRAIEAKLIEAHEQFFARRYELSIQAYLDASDLIHVQLVPNYQVGISRIAGITDTISPVLFDAMLSSSLEWLNVLPVRQPAIDVRPRIVVNPDLLLDSERIGILGVQSDLLMSSTSVHALADWQQARRYSRQGNLLQAAVFDARALRFSPDLVGLLNKPNNPAVLPPEVAMNPRVLGSVLGGAISQFKWDAGEPPPLLKIKNGFYDARIMADALRDLTFPPITPANFAIGLPHDLYYVIPLGLAECYHALGDYAKAETYYFQAAAYQYLNAAIEAPYIWQRIATLYLDWGNSLFREDDASGASSIYSKVLLPDGVASTGPLFTTASLKPGADQANAVIAHLGDLENIDALGFNPITAAVIVEIHQQHIKIQGKLDFWGFSTTTVPIWTFDYLQSVAVNFTQLAISAERDLINFWERADQATLTRQQLSQTVLQAQAEVKAAKSQARAARAETYAYESAKDLADKRKVDAQTNAEQYWHDSTLSIAYSAMQIQFGGGDAGDIEFLNSVADTLIHEGFDSRFPNFVLTPNRNNITAAIALTASRYNQRYEAGALTRQAEQMGAAAVQAETELTAAEARLEAAKAGTAVAKLRAKATEQNLEVFDNQLFTPDVWYRMGDHMHRLYRRYLTMAQRAARLMQQAYNFETDQNLDFIRGDYSNVEVKGLLAADTLMADIQTFTFDLITSTAGKPQPLKQTISLSQQYGYLFEKQLRVAGSMQFETRMEDFDYYYPGIYAGRIDAVEVEVVGIVPVTGISGTLTNNGISAYRLPASNIAPNTTGLKFRLQPEETLVLSDYATRADALLSPQDQRMKKVFNGAGLSSVWRLDLPKAINDIDYGALTDVRLTFYYHARFDPDLRDRVLAQLATFPGANSRVRSIPLRWVYPDAFFRFQDTGKLRITLKPQDFRANETKPVLTSIGVLVTTDDSESPGNLTVSLETPTQAAVAAVTDATGITNSDAGPWVPLAAGTALGNYTISMTAANNPQLVKNGKFSLAPIVNLALLFEYSFTPKA